MLLTNETLEKNTVKAWPCWDASGLIRILLPLPGLLGYLSCICSQWIIPTRGVCFHCWLEQNVMYFTLPIWKLCSFMKIQVDKVWRWVFCCIFNQFANFIGHITGLTLTVLLRLRHWVKFVLSFVCKSPFCSLFLKTTCVFF